MSLLYLPTELRQQILSLALPDTNRIGSFWPAQILSLFHINQRIRQEMDAVIGMWSPLHYVSTPSFLTNPQPQPLGQPKVERICLDLFHESEANRIMWSCYCSDPSTWTHPELIAAWAGAVPLLPKCVSEVWLDVTPAPAKKREQNCLALNRFVHGKCASRKFLAGHVRDVAALVRSIDEYYNGRVSVVVTGRLSTKSAFFVEGVSVASGRDVEFVGEWVSSDDARFARIGEAVQRMTSRRQTWQGKRCGEMHPLAWLRDVVWDEKSRFVFARAAHAYQEGAVVDDLRRIAEFKVGQSEELLLPPAGSLRRAFQHRTAADLDLKTVGEGDGDDRHVVVRR